MAAMRDRKGQFLKGFDGMKPVRPDFKKRIENHKKAVAKRTINAPLASGTTFAAPGSARGDGTFTPGGGGKLRVNVATRDLNAQGHAQIGTAKITKTQVVGPQGSVNRGDVNTGQVGVKLSKAQQDRVVARKQELLAGRDKSMKRRAAISAAKKGEQRNPAEAVQAANNAKVMNAAEMSPQQKIEAYQLMHGKAPSAAATKKLNAAGKRETARDFAEKTTVNKPTEFSKAELDAAQKKIDDLTVKGILKPAGADQQKVVSAINEKHRAAVEAKKVKSQNQYDAYLDGMKPAGGGERAARQAAQAEAEKANRAMQNRQAREQLDAMKAGGGNQNAVASPSAPATSKSYDELYKDQKNLEANLASLRSARLARGGKTTSAEEKRMKAEIEETKKNKLAASAREAKERAKNMPDPRLAADWIPEGSALDLKSKQRGGRANALGNALTSFLEKKDIGAKDLKPSGGDQQRVVPPAPTGPKSNLSTDQKKQLAELNNARKYLQDDKQYAQAMRGSSDQEEAEMADLQVHEAEKFVRHLEASLKAQGVDIKLADGPLSAGGAPTKAVVSPPKPPENTYKASLQRQAKEVKDLMDSYPKNSASWLRHYNIYSALTEKARKIRD